LRHGETDAENLTYYEYDEANELTALHDTDGWTYFAYDGMASRVSTLESSGLTYYDWDSINVLQEKDAAGQVTERQVHGYAPIVSVGDIVLIEKLGG
jgi:YD repeat-containing protein